MIILAFYQQTRPRDVPKHLKEFELVCTQVPIKVSVSEKLTMVYLTEEIAERKYVLELMAKNRETRIDVL